MGQVVLHIAEEHYKTAPEEVDRTIVTKADLEADRILKTELTGQFPEYGWLSEETKSDDARFKRQRVWIIDPIDGTREYVLGIPEFAISVALVDEGKPILGVVYNPLSGDLYTAVVGQGTTCNDKQVQCNHVPADKLKVEVSRSDIEKGRFDSYKSKMDLVPCGSIAYKLARLSAGKADGTLSITPKNEWDIAAGILLVREAGGTVTDLSGDEYQFNRKNTLVNGVIAASAGAYGMIKQMVEDNEERKQDVESDSLRGG